MQNMRMTIISLAAIACMCDVCAAKLPRVSVSRNGFVASDGKPFVPFGVNYYRPGTGWAPQVWKKFDAQAVRRDMQLLRSMGGNCVRVFLTYGSFYQEPGVLSQEGLARFDEFLAIAEQAGVYVHPTGPDHWEGTPQWAHADRYADEKMLAAQEQFWTLLASRYRGRGVIFAYDLLNEPMIRWDSAAMRALWNRTVPPDQNAPGDPALLEYQRFRESIADEWTRRQVRAIKAADADALVTVGLIQWSVPVLLPKISHHAAFVPARQARFLDFMEVHFYPLEGGLLDYEDQQQYTRNLAYLESVVREVAAPGKPVVIAEFGWAGGGGIPTGGDKLSSPRSAEGQARWCGDVVTSTAGLAVGWLNWGFYDQPEARDVSVRTGLLTAEGEEKPWAKRFRELAAQHAGRSIEPRKLGPRPALDWDACITDTRAGDRFRAEYTKAFWAERGG